MDVTELRAATLPAQERPLARPVKAAEADEAARKFEALLLNQALETMFEGIETDGPFGGGYGEEVFRSMMLEQVADSMATHGNGFGIAGHVRAQIAQYADIKEG